MARLVYQAEGNGPGLAAVYDSHGARVEILRGEERAAGPGWAQVGAGLAAKRIREYLTETGRMPTAALLERFQTEMGKRIQAFIDDPRGCPFQPMSLKAFEEEEERGQSKDGA